MEGKGRKYPTEGITVYYQPRLCIHAAECVRGLPQVFDTSKKPWIQPEHSTPEAIAGIIQRCPSGALQFERSDGGAAEPVPQNLGIKANLNGPLYVRGPITLKDAEDNVLYQGTRAAFCRCGQSQNKPFCDNSHRKVGFQAKVGYLEFAGEANA